MSSDMTSTSIATTIKPLFTLSLLEKNRVKEIHADPRALEGFKEIDALVHHSLKAPTLIQTHTPMGNTLKTPTAMKRPFEDEEIIQKLLRFRNQAPLSSRIIRP